MMLEANNISCGYGQREILKSVSFSVPEGEFIGILGPNGSGKTTLLKALIGAVPLSAGEVLLSGKNIKSMKRKEIAKYISYVPQISEPSPGFTVEEVVSMGRMPHIEPFFAYKQVDFDSIREALIKTNLLSLKDRDIASLSGGEYQRVIIARSLAQGSKIILLDEPTAHLDIKYQMEVLETVGKIKSVSAIAVFHDIALAKRYCERVIYIKSGSIYGDGPARELLTTEKISEIFDISYPA